MIDRLSGSATLPVSPTPQQGHSRYEVMIVCDHDICGGLRDSDNKVMIHGSLAGSNTKGQRHHVKPELDQLH